MAQMLERTKLYSFIVQLRVGRRVGWVRRLPCLKIIVFRTNAGVCTSRQLTLSGKTYQNPCRSDKKDIREAMYTMPVP